MFVSLMHKFPMPNFVKKFSKPILNVFRRAIETISEQARILGFSFLLNSAFTSVYLKKVHSSLI
jgi:hypothetical protein